MTTEFPVSAGVDFVNNIHHDTYEAIDPTKSDLSGKAVFITGASRGIGKEIAISYARAGTSKIGISVRSVKDFESVKSAIYEAASIAKRPTPMFFQVLLDVTDRNSVEEAAKLVEEKFGRLDILVNNAGYLETFAPIVESDPDDWWKTWTINMRGAYLVTRAFLPLLLASEPGDKTIINLSSIAAHILMKGGSAYQITKLALLRFAEFIGTEYAERGILAYSVHPGNILTDMGLKVPEDRRPSPYDTLELAADTMVWLTKEKREWLNGRYVSCSWDMQEFESKKEEVVKGDKLKVKMVV